MKVWAKTQNRFTKSYRKYLIKEMKKIFEWLEMEWTIEYEQQIEKEIDQGEEFYRYVHKGEKECKQ